MFVTLRCAARLQDVLILNENAKTLFCCTISTQEDLQQQEAHTGVGDTNPTALVGQNQNKSWVQALCQKKPTAQQRCHLAQAIVKHNWKGQH